MEHVLSPVCRRTLAAGAAIDPWLEAGQSQQLHLEGAKPLGDRRIGVGVDSRERALDQFEDRRFSLLPFDHRIDQLYDVRRVRVAIEIESEAARAPDDVGGFDEAKLVVPPRAERQSNVREGFERSHKSALRSQRSLGDTGDLAKVTCEETNDLVALAERAGA
jgi:hypothetical protein